MQPVDGFGQAAGSGGAETDGLEVVDEELGGEFGGRWGAFIQQKPDPAVPSQRAGGGVE